MTPNCGHDAGWMCLGCERVQCGWCDGTANDSHLCWECFDAEDDAAVAS